MPVEQIKGKRSGTGLRPVDHNRVCPGFTLFAPQSGGGKVYLIDNDGTAVYTWQMPYPPGNYGYLTERGTLFYHGKVIENSHRFISRQPWKGGRGARSGLERTRFLGGAAPRSPSRWYTATQWQRAASLFKPTSKGSGAEDQRRYAGDRASE